MDRRLFIGSSASLTLFSPLANRAFAAATDEARFVLGTRTFELAGDALNTRDTLSRHLVIGMYEPAAPIPWPSRRLISPST